MPTFDSLTGKLAPQSVLIRRYLIVRLAGRGGMSAIYQALDMSQERRKVAIKEMSQENLDDEERSEALTRFQQEAHLLSRLNHPNLPRIYDNFNSGGRSFLVMDFIDGKTLLQLLHDFGKPLAVDQVLHYADQLCDVLAYLHQQNPPIIFRDLKPTNVMITQDGRVYLVDFGIARFFKEGQHQDTTVLGSPGYAPPEQHGSSQTNPRSDLYALGATLHCCLTNRDPYHSPERFTFVPARQINPLVPIELDQLISRLLELDESRRPGSALEVKQSLARIRQQMRQPYNSGRVPAVNAAPAQPAAPPVHPATPPTAVASAIPAPAPILAPVQAPVAASSPAPAPVYQPAHPASKPKEPQGPMILRSSPQPPYPPAVQSPVYPGAPMPGGYPLHPPERSDSGMPATLTTHVWTLGFCSVFFLLLIVTIGSSFIAQQIGQPYPNNPAASLNHAAEAGLALLAIVAAIIIIAMTRSVMAIFLVLLNLAATIVICIAFLLQVLRDIQPTAQIMTVLGPAEINQLITYGLLAAGVISMFWILRLPFTWSDRIWILLFSAIICTCAFLQFPYADADSQNGQTKHILLLIALIVLIQNILMTGQMERKRKHF